MANLRGGCNPSGVAGAGLTGTSASGKVRAILLTSRGRMTMSRNAELLARRAKAVARGVASATPVYAARAENAEIWDVDGKRYIDFAGGIAVLNTGHRHPKVMAAAHEQLDLFTHTAFQVLAYEPYV